MGCVPSKEHEDGQAPPSADGGDGNWDGHIVSPSAWSVTPCITRAQLVRLRTEFWETRVEGDREMWAALRTAAEATHDAEGDALRDEVIKAAGLRPARDLVGHSRRVRQNSDNRHANATLERMYDERGALYEVPVFALLDPDNIDGDPACPEFKDAAAAVEACMEKLGPRRVGVN